MSRHGTIATRLKGLQDDAGDGALITQSASGTAGSGQFDSLIVI